MVFGQRQEPRKCFGWASTRCQLRIAADDFLQRARELANCGERSLQCISMPGLRKSLLSAQVSGFLLVAITILATFLPVEEIKQSRYYTPLGVVVPLLLCWFLYHAVEWLRKRDELAVTSVPLAPAALEMRRSQLIEAVRASVEGQLNQSLYRTARLDLALEDRPDAVTNLVNLMVQESEGERGPLPLNTSISAVYDAHRQGLLILGPAGSGKTTLLLELARDLLGRGDRKPGDPIPVIFYLATWTPKSGSFGSWLATELKRIYDVPLHVAAALVDSGGILPLLDALDEAAADYREACLQAINAFRREGNPLVVSSRIEDYERLAHALHLSGAVVVQPIGEERIRQYLLDTDAPAGLIEAFNNDQDLRDLLNTPLWLNVVLLACRDAPDLVLQPSTSPAELRRLILAHYVEHALTRPKAANVLSALDSAEKMRSTGIAAAPPARDTYRLDQTKQWLSFLASAMIQLNQRPFYLEGLNEDWLSPVRRATITRIFFRLLGGMASGFLLWLVLGPIANVGSAVSCAVAGLVLNWCDYQLADNLRWSWKAVWEGLSRTLLPWLARWAIGGSILAFVLVVSGLLPKLDYKQALPALALGGLLGLLSGLLFSPFVVLAAGLVAGEIPVRSSDNEGTRRSARNGLLAGFAFGLILFASFCALFFVSKMRVDFKSAIFFGTIGGLGVGLRKGGAFFLRHWFIRLELWRCGFAPFRYDRFLEYAVARNILRQVRGGYILIHPIVMEHFASLAPRTMRFVSPAATPRSRVLPRPREILANAIRLGLSVAGGYSSFYCVFKGFPFQELVGLIFGAVVLIWYPARAIFSRRSILFLAVSSVIWVPVDFLARKAEFMTPPSGLLLRAAVLLGSTLLPLAQVATLKASWSRAKLALPLTYAAYELASRFAGDFNKAGVRGLSEVLNFITIWQYTYLFCMFGPRVRFLAMLDEWVMSKVKHPFAFLRQRHGELR